MRQTGLADTMIYGTMKTTKARSNDWRTLKQTAVDVRRWKYSEVHR